MKRIIEHPSAPANGRTYWRSLGEYARTPDFEEWLHREFPAGAAEWDNDPLSRRSFLRLMGASLALAGLGLSGCRRPEAHLVPFTQTPEWVISGKNMSFATAQPRRRGAVPLLATTFDGRPTKMEGNPLHPASQGASDNHAQASVLDLYDPARRRHLTRSGKKAEVSELEAEINRIRAEAAGNGGASLAILADETLSPTRERLRAELLRQFPQCTWAVYEPLAPGRDLEAAAAAFGTGTEVRPDLSAAKTILAVDCDFLGSDEGDISDTRGFASGRRIRKPGDSSNRLYVAEPRFSLTGTMADHRLRLRAGAVGSFLLELARQVRSLRPNSELNVVLSKSPDLPLPQGVDPAWIRECAADLVAQGNRSLVLVGRRQPAAVQALGYAINAALGNVGTALRVQPRLSAPSTTIQSLSEKIRSNSIRTLILLGGDPVYNAPAELGWANLLASVPNTFHLSPVFNATSAMSTWFIPGTHYLEAWGDALAADGSTLCIQPMIQPLWAGESQLEFLTRWIGQPKPMGPALVRETFSLRTKLGAEKLEQEWNDFVREGFLTNSAGSTSRALNSSGVAALLPNIDSPASSEAGSLEAVFTHSGAVDDGRYANNGWLQEWPDPMTKLTWDNAILLSSKTADSLGLKNEIINGILVADMVKATLGTRTVEAPVVVAPGHADFAVSLPVGYGQDFLGPVAKGAGFDAYALRTTDSDYIAQGLRLERTGKTRQLAVTQEHQVMEGRDLVREAALSEFNQNPGWAKKVGMDAHIPKNQTFYPSPKLTGEHQWAMVVDLSTCTGCNACVTACTAENNIPVVGKDQVMKGREMHWIRVDRYYTGEPEEPEAVSQPVACMQCENAPCETVCPVNATVHNEEGLNVMAYNRCIGTRYCANNCPYKVRRFNFFDYNQRPLDKLYWGPLAPKGTEETLKLQKNPNVTVRMRGVMEKCTFCVQRIEEAKINARVKARDSDNIRIPSGSLQTACQQACPADAIVFGDLKDEQSEVSQLRSLPQNYSLLEYLNVRPRLTYLGRIRNPNPAMPGARTSYVPAHGHEESHGHENSGENQNSEEAHK
ncbi:MAG: 4Fe-4S dicluster domain-containing protein [Verrucomicrobia bacterium]|nr:4Fe-4S dicluster domain-containing protein [Verrucomicrobiota bacterium]